MVSQVTYGYVGNTMATFVMQAMGMEVAAINTVNFSKCFLFLFCFCCSMMDLGVGGGCWGG
jgi:hypothetical protein